MLHDPSTASARIFSSTHFSYDVRQRIADLSGLSPTAYTVFRRLEDHAVVRGGHLTTDDDKSLARLAGVTVKRLHAAFREIWDQLGERLCALSDGILSFVLAQKECDFRASQSSRNSANAKQRWNAKSLKDNDQAHATASFSHMPNECPTTTTTTKKDSPCSPPRGTSPRFGFPDLDERATTEPDPGPASEAAKASAAGAETPPPPKAPRRPKKPATKFVAPEDWRPSAAILERFRGEGFSDSELDRHIGRFVNYGIANGRGYADHNAAFRNWMSNEKPQRTRASCSSDLY